MVDLETVGLCTRPMGLGAYRAYWLNDDMEGVLLQN